MNSGDLVKVKLWIGELTDGTVQIDKIDYGFSDKGNTSWYSDFPEPKRTLLDWRDRIFIDKSELLSFICEELHISMSSIEIIN